jgi:hypothetical protein
MHWSDCHDRSRTLVLQNILVMILFSSRSCSCTRMLTMSCLDRQRTSTNEPQALMAANRPPDRPHISHGIRFLISTQGASGNWPHESITGVCNNHGMITYMNYRHAFPIHGRLSGSLFLTFRIRTSRDAGVGLPRHIENNGSSTCPRHAYLLISCAMHSVDKRMHASHVHDRTEPTGATCACLARTPAAAARDD